jgi:hypothetical protein
MIMHLALALLLPAALLTWRWSRLVSVALWLTLAVWLAFRGLRWAYPDAWAAGHLEWMRGVSMVTGLVGAVEIAQRQGQRRAMARFGRWAFSVGYREQRDDGAAEDRAWERVRREMPAMMRRHGVTGRPDCLAALLVASMGVDLAALLIHRGTGQWGPLPVFQCIVLLVMCAVAWPRRK